MIPELKPTFLMLPRQEINSDVEIYNTTFDLSFALRGNVELMRRLVPLSFSVAREAAAGDFSLGHCSMLSVKASPAQSPIEYLELSGIPAVSVGRKEGRRDRLLREFYVADHDVTQVHRFHDTLTKVSLYSHVQSCELQIIVSGPLERTTESFQEQRRVMYGLTVGLPPRL